MCLIEASFTELGGLVDFDEFYATSAQRVARQVYALTGDLGEAQDVTQEAFARAWQRWSSIGTFDAPEAWVRTVAMRLAVSRFRKSQNAMRAWRRHGPPPHLPPADPGVVALVSALRTLPVEQRTAVVLHHLVDLSVDEVAAEMGRSPGTVKSWLYRGRASLAQILADADQPPPREELAHNPSQTRPEGRHRA